MLTVADVRTWTGRTAQDPYGEALGTIAGALHDVETGSPEWLVVAADGDDAEGMLVPLGGAVPTGMRIRVVPTADAVRSAPHVRVGEELDIAAKRRAAAHYGLALDQQVSGSGQLRPPSALAPKAAAEPADSPPPAGEAARRAAVVQALRAAHAMEQASLKLLAAMRWRERDEELVHDLALHHKETNRHAERLRERLDALAAPRARPLDWAAKLVAYVQAQLGRARSRPDAGDLRAAHAFERGEIAAYDRLERLAREAGDEPTAALARAIRADELAMLMTIEHSRVWPGSSSEPTAEAPRT
jgi:ferritin-like metal-binding protein YciE